MHIQSMHKCIYLGATNALAHERPVGNDIGGFRQAKKTRSEAGLSDNVEVNGRTCPTRKRDQG